MSGSAHSHIPRLPDSDCSSAEFTVGLGPETNRGFDVSGEPLKERKTRGSKTVHFVGKEPLEIASTKDNAGFNRIGQTLHKGYRTENSGTHPTLLSLDNDQRDLGVDDFSSLGSPASSGGRRS